MTTFDVRRTVAAAPETVFDVFTDHRKYAGLVTAIRSSVLEREGVPAPNGVGAIRRLHMPGATVREQVTEFRRPGRYSYRMLSGMPLRYYTATVAFAPAQQRQRTDLVYTVTVEPRLRALGPVLSRVVKKVIADFTDAAVARAESLTAQTARHPHPPGRG